MMTKVRPAPSLQHCAAILGFVLLLAGTAAAAPDPGADDLRAALAALQAAIEVGDQAEAAAMTRALLPTGDQIGSALGAGADADIRARIIAFHAGLPRDDASLAGLLASKPGQTEIGVHAATTEEIAAYAEGSVAYAEFPGGARDLAGAGILKPGLTFYEAEFVEPGEDAGIKYHLFFWNGTSWSMLGPLWRALR